MTRDGGIRAWLDRLEFEPKKKYAEAYLRARLEGKPLPPEPGHGIRNWPAKARQRIDKLLREAAAEAGPLDSSIAAAPVPIVERSVVEPAPHDSAKDEETSGLGPSLSSEPVPPAATRDPDRSDPTQLNDPSLLQLLRVAHDELCLGRNLTAEEFDAWARANGHTGPFRDAVRSLGGWKAARSAAGVTFDEEACNSALRRFADSKPASFTVRAYDTWRQTKRDAALPAGDLVTSIVGTGWSTRLAKSALLGDAAVDDQNDVAPSLRKRGPKPKESSVRDAAIVARWMEGETLEATATEFGLTRERVRQIVKTSGAQRTQDSFAKKRLKFDDQWVPVIRARLDSGEQPEDIAVANNLSVSAVKELIARHGLTVTRRRKPPIEPTFSDDYLLEQLQTAESVLGPRFTSDSYTTWSEGHDARPSIATVTNRLGSWSRALDLAGLGHRVRMRPERSRHWTQRRLIEALRLWLDETPGNPTVESFEKFSEAREDMPSTSLVRTRLGGSWYDVVALARAWQSLVDSGVMRPDDAALDLQDHQLSLTSPKPESTPRTTESVRSAPVGADPVRVSTAEEPDGISTESFAARLAQAFGSSNSDHE